MDIVKIFNRALIACDACLRAQIKRKEKRDRKTILIVFHQVFGDSVVLQNSLKEYANIFPKDQGYNVKVLVRPSVLKFMEDTLVLSDELTYETVDFKLFLEKYSYYRQIIKKYRGMANILIVPGTSMSGEIFAAASDAHRKIGLVRSTDITHPFAMAVFNKVAYTERVRPDKEDMMLQRHRRLLHYLGATEYKAKLPELLKKEKVVKEEKYVVVCPGSSLTEKCWPTERFVEVIDYIVEKYDMNVHLCGGADELEYEKIIIKNSKYSRRIVSHIGKTNFSDWSSIVQHATLVLGNDSATMHLAAASRRKAICIAGVYDKYQFFPYKVDELDEKDRLPVTLMKDMPCEWCRTIGYAAGYGNPECKKRIDEDKCACCIDLVTVNEMKSQIDLLMAEK